MANLLYKKQNINSRYQAEIRSKIKACIGTTPPNIDTLNKKIEADQDSTLYFYSNEVMHMVLRTHVPVKKQNNSEIFLIFKKAANGLYDFVELKVAPSWPLINRYLMLNYNANIEMKTEELAALTAEDETTDDDKLEALEPIDEAFELTETDCSANVDNVEISEEDSETDSAVVTETDNADVDDSISEDMMVFNASEQTLSVFDKRLTDHAKAITKNCNLDGCVPPIDVFHACVKANKLNLSADEFRAIILRLICCEWANWLLPRIPADLSPINGKLLIDTGFLKLDGQNLYILVTISNNYPRRTQLDVSLTDIVANGLTRTDAVNQLTTHSARLLANPLRLDNIDISALPWKQHLLVKRSNRLGRYSNLTYGERMHLVIDSIEHACKLEERGINVKRFIRGGINQLSVAIPLRPLGIDHIDIAIILRLNKDNVWEITTVEYGTLLKKNLQTYNFYDMPCWLVK